MKYLLITLLSCLLTVACLPFEPVMGGGVFYNFCKYSIEWRHDDISDEDYEKNRSFGDSIKPDETIYTMSPVQSNLEERKRIVQKNYFVEKGNKTKRRFYIDMYGEGRTNFIACPENAKPTGDGNWIRVK
ncbi:hypothetical protein EDC44_10453 [Cricetibacter osteomyelitidis]|uniref:Lipoprotein n=1 Tax=Cricetibacter osteomyelitidis TaxID=1521931 RepID=A0A4R2T2R5_9PAST|nr:hypothetical protein [Cricetibacter osteomyelitidis]TCP96520.1 hypothetical protein EDC44_10453 [Cricetibacter osteomyelitidis]